MTNFSISSIGNFVILLTSSIGISSSIGVMIFRCPTSSPCSKPSSRPSSRPCLRPCLRPFSRPLAYYNVEINYSHNPITDFKNMCYICELFLRQLKSKTPKVYSKIKKVLQININGYDRFSQGKFIYTSHISEDALHQIRNDCLKIVDINLDYLAEMNYNNLEKYESDSLERLLYVFEETLRSVLLHLSR